MSQRLTQSGRGDIETTSIHLPFVAAEPVLAVGAELKSSICILAGREAVFTDHLGDLANPTVYRNFIATVESLQNQLNIKPAIVAHDLHPDYAASRYALSLGLQPVGVQHHHAHIVACMADNELTGDVIGVCCDGTGYGTDGSIWGCEVLVCGAGVFDFQRAGHLRTFPLIGGDAAALETWRPAAGLMHETFDDFLSADDDIKNFKRVESMALKLMSSRLKAGRALRTSSLGRVFDAVAFLLNICDCNETEAMAPIALESAAGLCDSVESLAWRVTENEAGAFEMDYRPMISDLMAGLSAGRSREELAGAFHETVASMLADCVSNVAAKSGLKRVVLSGGCFLNRILLARLKEKLRKSGLSVYTHKNIPPSDVGVSLGQAVSVAARNEKIKTNHQ